MKYKILALDIDGTLHNSDKIITPKTKAALMKIQKLGVKIALASGRLPSGIMPVAKELEMDKFGGYVLGVNGGYAIDAKTGETLYEKSLSNSFIPKLLKIANENHVNLWAYNNGRLITEGEIDDYALLESRLNNLVPTRVTSIVKEVTYDTPKCMICGDPANIEKALPFAKKLEPLGINTFISAPFFLEVVPEGIDKAYGLSMLCKRLNLSKQEIIACGDSGNDLPMIEFAGLGVAMENAQQAIKDAAGYITLSCDNDGIEKVIEEFILKEELVRI